MTTWTAPFGPASLRIDAEREITKVTESLYAYLARTKRRGVVVAMSGGIDSSVVAALCVTALGKERVFGLHMPERESSPETITLSRLVTEWLGIGSAHEDISLILEGPAATGAETTRSARSVRTTGRVGSQRSCCRA